MQIAANAVANNLDGVGVLAGAAMNLAILTVVGRCVGAHDNDQVRYYTRKLLKIEYAMMVAVNVVLLAALPLILNLYTLSPASRELATQLVFHPRRFRDAALAAGALHAQRCAPRTTSNSPWCFPSARWSASALR
ncbi:MAG: MATE family efflux transporter [Christensenellales bacterium]